MIEGVTLHQHDGADAGLLLDHLAEVYVQARDEPPYEGPVWTREAFLDRTREQAARPGFALVTADADGALVGFAFGLPFEARRWFRDTTDPADELLAAPKFAVIELNVLRSWRGQGIGHALLDALLSDRPEPYAILTSMPAAPAWAMYQRWGWVKVAETLPDRGLPPWDTLALLLSGAGGEREDSD